MLEIISAVFMLVGAFFMVVAGVGLVRMPDLFLRMSASTKASTLGVGCTLVGVAAYFGDVTAFMRAAAIIVFLLATAPVAAHLIGRAAYKDGVSLWDRTLFDELGQYYEQIKASPPEPLQPVENVEGRNSFSGKSRLP